MISVDFTFESTTAPEQNAKPGDTRGTAAGKDGAGRGPTRAIFGETAPSCSHVSWT